MDNPEDPFKIEIKREHSGKQIAVVGIFLLLAIAIVLIAIINPFKSQTNLTTNSFVKNATSVFSNNSIQSNKTNLTVCQNKSVIENGTFSIFNKNQYNYILPSNVFIVNISMPANLTKYLMIYGSFNSSRNIPAGIMTSGGLANAIKTSPINIKAFSIIYLGSNKTYSIDKNISMLPIGNNYIIFYNNHTNTVSIGISKLNFTYQYLEKIKQCN
jgi:hypothetical protein